MSFAIQISRDFHMATRENGPQSGLNLTKEDKEDTKSEGTKSEGTKSEGTKSEGTKSEDRTAQLNPGFTISKTNTLEDFY